MVHFDSKVLKLQLKDYLKNKKYKNLKFPTKHSSYYDLLKLKSVLYDLKYNFLYDITNYHFDPETRILTLDGWGLTKKEGLPINIEISRDQGEVVSFKRVDNLEINDRYNIPEEVVLGFHFEIKLSDKEDPDNFNLILKNQYTGEVVPITARAQKGLHMAPLDFFEYYDKIRREKGEEQMQKTYEMQGDHPWDAYNQWFHYLPKKSEDEIKAEIESFAEKPKISIVVPVYNVDEVWLRKMIETVRGQYYENWELCLADDASPSDHVKKVLSEYAAIDPRIKFTVREKNGHISEATNSALDLATGDFIGFMDHDDELESTALYEVVKAINENNGVDFIYTDQDFVDTNGYRYEPFYKANWNPRLLQSQNYISHFVVVSKDLLDKTGRLRSKYDGSQDYDFILRATDNANQVVHIPKILYHWRTLAGSVAEDPEAKKYAYINGSNAITQRMQKKGIKAKAVPSEYYGIYDIIREDEPSVTVIIIGDNSEDALKTLKFIANETDYSNYNIIAVNFDKEIESKTKIEYIWNNAPISRTKLYNWAAQRATGEFLCFMEAYALPESENWLKNMVNETANEDVGLVGSLVVDDQNKVLNAGMAFDRASDQILYCHRDYTIRPEFLGYYFRLIVPQNVAAVSSVCFLISRKLYDELEGLNENYTRPALDIDTSIRAREIGKETVWTPRAKFIWKGEVSDYAPEHFNQPGYYLEANPNQVTQLLEDFTDEQLEDPYTEELIKRFRRLASPNYSGPEELRNV